MRITTILFLIPLLAIGCATNKPKPISDDEPMATKISYMTESLLSKIQESQGMLGAVKIRPDLVVINPFIDTVSGQVVKASLDIEDVMLRRSATPCDERAEAGGELGGKQFILCRLDERTFSDASYIINGGLSHEMDPLKGEVRYRVTASVVALETKRVVASEQVWLNEKELDYTPVFSFADSPIYGINKIHQELLDIISAEEGEGLNDSIELLRIESLIAEANSAYQQRDYQRAKDVFFKASQYPAGKGNLKVFGGLYAANFRLGNLEEAEEAFGKMVAVGMANRQIPLKLMFESGSTEFLANPEELKVQYRMWLRQIGAYLADNEEVCLLVVGYSSKPGHPQRNLNLSQARANAVKERLTASDPSIQDRIATEGMGSAKAKVEADKDSPQTAIDRRVELDRIECGG